MLEFLFINKSTEHVFYYKAQQFVIRAHNLSESVQTKYV